MRHLGEVLEWSVDKVALHFFFLLFVQCFER